MCWSTPRSEVTLPGSAKAPRSAREFLVASICVHHAMAVLDDALLLTSEAVTNAVVHGARPIVVAVDCVEVAMEVRVRDGSPNPPVRRAPDQFDPHGRGMLLVDALSSAWGVEPVSEGKEVWFLLRTAR